MFDHVEEVRHSDTSYYLEIYNHERSYPISPWRIFGDSRCKLTKTPSVENSAVHIRGGRSTAHTQPTHKHISITPPQATQKPFADFYHESDSVHWLSEPTSKSAALPSSKAPPLPAHQASHSARLPTYQTHTSPQDGGIYIPLDRLDRLRRWV